MCFSAEASFGASIVISTIGVVAYKKAEKTPLRLLAMIPLFFGVQQFFEGLVWIGLNGIVSPSILNVSTYGFIIFAWVIWPIFIPFSLWVLEKNKLRKSLILTTLLVGIISSTSLVLILIFRPINAEIKDCSIFYNFDAKHSLSWLLGAFYLSSTVFVNFISSLKKMWILGLLNCLTYFLAKIYYHEQTISVWCFYAAVTSVMIIWVIRSNHVANRIVK